ncbi:Wall-associated receptor kinase 3 [Dichanthelium oligosanthes]|uniref:Wall-associated receptor kinase 3 n=1 Tax=Dichanthelium oligosanthes TaxID=888268 RepID=A0A1E5V9J6_9POAL|nr:Wall-associated receptor kinase 3 [Dichanthelium oligosanthes]
MVQVLWFLLTSTLTISLLVPPPAVAAEGSNPSNAAPPAAMQGPEPGCLRKCGEVDVPYPFGIGDDACCSWRGKFSLTCNDTFDPPRLYTGTIQVFSISLEAGEVRVVSPVSYLCYNSPRTLGLEVHSSLNVSGTPFLLSRTRNVFTAIGCSMVAWLDAGSSGNDLSYFTGCISYCAGFHEAGADGEPCTGLGCCQTSIPGNLSNIAVKATVNRSNPVDNPAWESCRCGYAFVSEKDWYNFSREDLTGVGKNSFISRFGMGLETNVPLVLDWAIRNGGSCPPPEDSGGSAKPSALACVSDHSFCVNATQGPGYLSTFSSAILACFAWMELRKRDKRKHFDKNGGEVLKGVGITIFTEGQVKEITNGYKNMVGKGAYGEVYKGTIGGAQPLQVAVKRPVAKRPEIGKDEFVKEITFQFRITHANVVRLVGCCLETDVPILVFEFVPNGSLYDVLHGTNRTRMLSLPERLGIAVGSAEALSYMHSHAEHHVHGDVKSANILLDNNLMPKVSDFGSSKLLRMGMYSRSVVADISYLDPVYMKTGRFTEKSDVYSFGVVLLELITRKTAKYDGDKSLPIEFAKPWKRDDDGNKRGMYDSDILSAAGALSKVYMECLDMIGKLAVQCHGGCGGETHHGRGAGGAEAS